MPAVALTFQPKTADGGWIMLGRKKVAEIQRLALVHFIPQPGAVSLVGAAVGVPFYWRQYGNHQDPERRLDHRRRLSLLEQSARTIRLRATGMTRSGSACSDYAVTFRIDSRGRLRCEVEASLEIPPGPGWRVTPHPHHGEAVFCTLWPTGVFSPDGRGPKRYDSCLVQRGHRDRRILHHHLESPDKQRINLGPGDRFTWALENLNPQLTIGPGTRSEAGVCAYMWDTHFALRVCRANRDVLLKSGTVLRAAYILEGKTRRQLAPAYKRAIIASSGAAAGTPMYRSGRHTFAETFRDVALAGNTAWPWQREVVQGCEADVAMVRDTRMGCGDRYSLKIQHQRTAQSRWLATTLGSAFGEPPFARGQRLRLRAKVKTADLHGAVGIALRVHRTGRGSVYDVAGYDVFASPPITAQADWTELQIETPPLRPAPDRVHFLLELNGRGTAWFDDVELLKL
jgi:hypothetical protein